MSGVELIELIEYGPGETCVYRPGVLQYFPQASDRGGRICPG